MSVYPRNQRICKELESGLDELFAEPRCLECELPVVFVDIEHAPPALARSPRLPLRKPPPEYRERGGRAQVSGRQARHR
jgi:hypothetical protein